ncbi:MAG: S8 family serine peptidase [Clostridiales bacterium]|nr:S8 family serine peptidase [Clostridiales bacterium]
MNNEKLDNLLNLALDAMEEEREKSEELNVGYDSAKKTWQLIVKASGSLEGAEPISDDIVVRPLLNGYAVLTVPQDQVEEVSRWAEIEYVEKPKRLFFAVNEGRRVSCVSSLQMGMFPESEMPPTEMFPESEMPPTGTFLENEASQIAVDFGALAESEDGPPALYGAGVLVAVIDSGIDYAHPDFRNADGTTRIVSLWDQTLDRVYGSNEINEALAQKSEQERYALVPSRDSSGHGTHVAGICAGNGRASDGLYRGVAPAAPLLIVKMGTADPDGFPRTTELMLAVDYVLRTAKELQMPVAVNLSFGNNYGSHWGTSLVETYLTEVSSFWKSVIVAGTGNEGTSRIHASGTFSEESAPAGPTRVISFSVGAYEPSLNLQLWKSYEDQFDISIRSPDGRIFGPLDPGQQIHRYASEGTELLVYYGEPRPYSTDQEIYFDFIPQEVYVTPGVWEMILQPRRIVAGRYDLWLPGASVLSEGTGFLMPTADNTITIPATALKVISVGAYDAAHDSYASFSGRGGDSSFSGVKPDLAAPGVNIISCAPGGGYTAASGTSMAAPFVTGGSALLMEWGICLGNDAWLYGEKVKAYLRRGARPLPGFSAYPNDQVGYGALCVRDSLPRQGQDTRSELLLPGQGQDTRTELLLS